MAEHDARNDRPDSDWRILHRCDEPVRAIAITTAIASMGFDVECEGSGGEKAACDRGCPADAPALGDPPYFIRVPAEHFTELAPVLDEIVAEQVGFDELLAQRLASAKRFRRRIMLVFLIIVIATLGLLGLLQM